MRRIAFLSADNLEGYVVDDDLSHTPLRELGWEVETISWRRRDVDWSKFAAAIVRSTWDYQRDLPAFLTALNHIAGATRLANPLEVVRWNADKIYLRLLSKRGARIPRTIWSANELKPTAVEEWFDELGTSEIVIKPTVSANAEKTVRLRRGDYVDELNALFEGRPYMVQPFVKGIVEEGEYSLFYFCGQYSHAILKTPKTDDFRVQEEHGGVIKTADAGDELREAGAAVLNMLDQQLLYARVDLVRDGNEYLLMELELIEPSLYLRMAESAPKAFAAAIDGWLSS